MLLSDEEQRMLDGGRGEAAARALRDQIAVGEFWEAQRFVPITNVHMMGDYEVMGDAGARYLRDLIDAGARATVPVTRNAQCVEYEFAERLAQSPALVEGERDVRSLLQRLGIATVDTCINYQSLYTPTFGEHVAWGDTGTVAYANAVLGARTNYESGPAAIAAAITGRVPAYGFHLDEARRANFRWVVEAPLRDVADYGALSAIVGERTRGYWNVPYLELRDATPGPDELKHLSAGLASFGSLAMYHVESHTPEAPGWDAANRGRSVEAEEMISAGQLDDVYARSTPSDRSCNLVVFSAPQLSLLELDELARLFAGRRVAEGSTVLITTNAMMRVAAEATGALAALRESGALVLQGVCWYIMEPERMRESFGWTRVCTNSAKLYNIIRAHGYEPILRRTADCVETAITGRLP